MPETPRIIMEFVGGSEDGTRYDDDPARAYYWSADHGRVGAAAFALQPFQPAAVRSGG